MTPLSSLPEGQDRWLELMTMTTAIIAPTQQRLGALAEEARVSADIRIGLGTALAQPIAHAAKPTTRIEDGKGPTQEM